MSYHQEQLLSRYIQNSVSGCIIVLRISCENSISSATFMCKKLFTLGAVNKCYFTAYYSALLLSHLHSIVTEMNGFMAVPAVVY